MLQMLRSLNAELGKIGKFGMGASTAATNTMTKTGCNGELLEGCG